MSSVQREGAQEVTTIRRALPRVTAWIQGTYFFVFGLWPIISIRSFQAVTGKKTDHLVTGLETDHWLVNTVGLLLAAIGASLLTAGWHRRISLEIIVLGATSALALAVIDVVYVLRDTISPIYLLDAVVEFAFVGVWVACAFVRQ